MGRDNYTPSRFMLPTSHFDREKGERAVRFIEMLKHTKGNGQGSGSACLTGSTIS